jgi:hypothetical protein
MAKQFRKTRAAYINWDAVGKYFMAGASTYGVASLIGVTENCLRQRCRKDLGVEITEFKRLKLAEGNELLRARQFQMAMNGDRTMLVWLGKNRLGQSDKVNIEHDGLDPQANVLRVEFVAPSAAPPLLHAARPDNETEDESDSVH